MCLRVVCRQVLGSCPPGDRHILMIDFLGAASVLMAMPVRLFWRHDFDVPIGYVFLGAVGGIPLGPPPVIILVGRLPIVPHLIGGCSCYRLR